MNRYMKHHWKWRQLAHSVSGILMQILTVLAFIITFDASGWKIILNAPHARVANPTVWVGVCTAFGGMITMRLRSKSGEPQYEW